MLLGEVVVVVVVAAAASERYGGWGSRDCQSVSLRTPRQEQVLETAEEGSS